MRLALTTRADYDVFGGAQAGTGDATPRSEIANIGAMT